MRFDEKIAELLEQENKKYYKFIYDMQDELYEILKDVECEGLKITKSFIGGREMTSMGINFDFYKTMTKDEVDQWKIDYTKMVDLPSKNVTSILSSELSKLLDTVENRVLFRRTGDISTGL